MAALGRRTSATLIALAFAVSNAAVCAGWTPAPEAEMACCAPCPMHAPDHAPSPLQPRADACCAASENRQSTPSPAALALALAPDLAPIPAALAVPDSAAQRDAWRTFVPLPPPRVPTHLLLSVFLV
ncbi:MAG: hypothetical protein IT176_06580 [Acidobacteria bacterium]|nr:hypothetical protein [Acidobacteriota bacterium]